MKNLGENGARKKQAFSSRVIMHDEGIRSILLLKRQASHFHYINFNTLVSLVLIYIHG